MMEVELRKYRVEEITNGFSEASNSSQVIAMGGKLDIRPKYQREYVYDEEKRDKVIDTVLRGLPLGVMYFVERDDGSLEVLDGQQRLISICRYSKNDFSIKPPDGVISQMRDGRVAFNVLYDGDKERFNNYELNVYICKGTYKDKIDWFETINIAGEPLERQEILNAVLHSKWLDDAKTYFSKRNCPAYRQYSKYMKGNYIRQDYLATVFSWAADTDSKITEKDKKRKIEHYMQKHRGDDNAKELWEYFESVFSWVKKTFRNYDESMKGVEWGYLYNAHNQEALDADSLAKEVKDLLEDPDVTNKHGIYEYVLNKNEKVLNIRSFSISDKITKYNEQDHKCAKCGKKCEDIKEMEADHITPWHDGGKTTLDNCQMLCKKCNREKGGR